jgi:branched-chain amino acid transport system ATP-binding protein
MSDRQPPSGLRLEGVSAWYGQAKALDGVSLHVERGEVVGIVGSNGAGKSTLLRTIARIHPSAQGRIEIDSGDLLALNADQAALRGVSLVREAGRVFENMTVTEHLSLAGALARKRGKEPGFKDAASTFPMLAELAGLRGGLLSGGQRQMLCLAMAVVGRPEYLLLDEPSAGLAESVSQAVFAAIRQIAGAQIVCLIAEQDERWLAGIAHRVYTLETGSIIDERSADLAAAPAAG